MSEFLVAVRIIFFGGAGCGEGDGAGVWAGLSCLPRKRALNRCGCDNC